jgi:hypothetical protein
MRPRQSRQSLPPRRARAPGRQARLRPRLPMLPAGGRRSRAHHRRAGRTLLLGTASPGRPARQVRAQAGLLLRAPPRRPSVRPSRVCQRAPSTRHPSTRHPSTRHPSTKPPSTQRWPRILPQQSIPQHHSIPPPRSTLHMRRRRKRTRTWRAALRPMAGWSSWVCLRAAAMPIGWQRSSRAKASRSPSRRRPAMGASCSECARGRSPTARLLRIWLRSSARPVRRVPSCRAAECLGVEAAQAARLRHCKSPTRFRSHNWHGHHGTPRTSEQRSLASCTIRAACQPAVADG